MDEKSLGERFCSLWQACAGADAGVVWQKLQQHYTEPHRHYHTLEHLAHCLRELDIAKDHVVEFSATEMAIWFHDIIYQPQSKKGENETQSNELFIEWHNSTSNDDKEQQEVSQIILATIDHKPVADCPKSELFLDLDLSVLGWNP